MAAVSVMSGVYAFLLFWLLPLVFGFLGVGLVGAGAIALGKGKRRGYRLLIAGISLVTAAILLLLVPAYPFQLEVIHSVTGLPTP